MFETQGHKSGRMEIIKGFDRIFDILDEDILKIQRLQFSIYKKHFEHEILQWGKNLSQMSDVCENWAKL